jgi:glycosyltransferase involved in cell wall biosynthesis
MNAWAALNSHANFLLLTNGLNTARFDKAGEKIDRGYERSRLGFKEDDVVVLCVGTTAARKGQHDLLLALMKLPNEIRGRVQVVFVGARAGTYLDRLRATLESFPKRLRDRVAFIAETENVAGYYRLADIFFCGSRVESYPRVILEASAAGLPIITTPVSGIPEQVREGMNAFFYQPGHIADLADTLARLVVDNGQRQEAGNLSKQVFATLTSYEEMLDRYQETIEQAAFSSSPAREGRPSFAE